MFTTYAGMIIHLESGACDSGIDILDLNESAAECFQWQKYLDGEYREDMLNCKDLAEEYRDTVYPFKCPTCEDVFSKLSGLFQHVNSTTCEQRLGKGSIAKLVKWLENKHSWLVDLRKRSYCGVFSGQGTWSLIDDAASVSANQPVNYTFLNILIMATLPPILSYYGQVWGQQSLSLCRPARTPQTLGKISPQLYHSQRQLPLGWKSLVHYLWHYVSCRFYIILLHDSA